MCHSHGSQHFKGESGWNDPRFIAAKKKCTKCMSVQDTRGPGEGWGVKK